MYSHFVAMCNWLLCHECRKCMCKLICFFASMEATFNAINEVHYTTFLPPAHFARCVQTTKFYCMLLGAAILQASQRQRQQQPQQCNLLICRCRNCWVKSFRCLFICVCMCAYIVYMSSNCLRNYFLSRTQDMVFAKNFANSFSKLFLRC